MLLPTIQAITKGFKLACVAKCLVAGENGWQSGGSPVAASSKQQRIDARARSVCGGGGAGGMDAKIAASQSML